jgi:Uma2 family endonuclease
MEARSQERMSRWTYAEYARLPESGSTRHEVIAGDVAVTPAPTSRHQRIAAELVSYLHTYTRAHGLGQVYVGPLDILFAAGDYFQPDIVFIRADRLDILSERGVEAPPDLVVEIPSPATAHRDRGIKLDRYRMYGVPEYWIVDPEANRIEAWHLREGAEAPESMGSEGRFLWEPTSDATPLEIDLADLFRA